MKVKKEITVAIIIGLIIALVVTGGILRAKKAIQSMKVVKKDVAVESKPQQKEQKSSDLFLDITTDDNVVTDTPKLTISGKTLPGTYIAILGEKNEYLLVPSDLGIFSQEISLVKGANIIKVTVYQDDGKKVQSELNAVYTTAQL